MKVFKNGFPRHGAGMEIALLAALCALLFASCLSFSVSSSNVKADGQTTVKGLLQRDGDGYFISYGDDYIGWHTFYFVRDNDAPDAWSVVTSSVGKNITIDGYVAKEYDDGSLDIAVTQAHLWQTQQ